VYTKPEILATETKALPLDAIIQNLKARLENLEAFHCFNMHLNMPATVCTSQN
jgi:hypothetical protein